MTSSQDPSLWELLGLDRNDTIPELIDEMWEQIVAVATSPDTPDIGADLLPDDDIVTGDADGYDVDAAAVELGDDTEPDRYDSPVDTDPFIDDSGPDDSGPTHHDAPPDLGFGSDDVSF